MSWLQIVNLHVNWENNANLYVVDSLLLWCLFMDTSLFCQVLPFRFLSIHSSFSRKTFLTDLSDVTDI